MMIVTNHDDRQFVYRITSTDHFVFANEHWYDFAKENGADTLNPSTLLGRSLWDFIADEQTKHLYQALVAKVRETAKTISVTYRCDSPTQRRFMEMAIIPKSGGTITFESRIQREESRDTVPVLDSALDRSNELVTACGWCKKFRHSDGRWLEVEDAVRALRLFEATKLPRISHAICDECASRIIAMMESESHR